MALQIEEKVAKEGWSVAVLESRTIVTLPEKCALVPPPTPGPPAHLVPVAMFGQSWRTAGLHDCSHSKFWRLRTCLESGTVSANVLLACCAPT